MKNLLTVIISMGIGAAMGSGATYYISQNAAQKKTENSQVTALNNLIPGSTTQKGKDKYEIRWYGKPTDEGFFGSYTIMEDNKPVRVEQVPKSPHIVKLTLSKGAIVGAMGNSKDLKIFRNGKECGQTGVVGAGIPANKSCL
jgi:hypothetical protein